MSTPEDRVKSRVRAVLDRYQDVWHLWPVPTGRGRKTVDMLGCYRGRFFAIETKAPGKKPTMLQEIELRHVAEAMGKTFVIDGPTGLDELVAWLDNLTETINYDPHIPEASVNRRAI